MQRTEGGPSWLTRRLALVVSVVVLALIGWGLVAGPSTPSYAVDTGTGNSAHHDIELYREIATRVAAGGNYYQVAVPLQAEWHFPTSPVATVREPLEAWTVAALGATGAQILLPVLLAAGFITMLARLERATSNRFEWYASMLFLVVTASSFLVPGALYLHECWAMTLILLSLAVRTDRRWWPAVVFGVAAVMFRETALVYLGTMAAVALFQKRWSEVAGWAGGGLAWLGFYVWHIHEVALAQVAAPLSAPPWLALGGWPFVVSSVRFSSGLVLAPYWIAALIVPLALFGWLFARGPVALRAGLTALAFATVFLVVGRDINLFYWGLLYAGALLPGLAFAPRGILVIARRLRRSEGARSPGL
ncbi:MAG TPA: hypothetical protein VIL68_13720 [Propionibacteriaceae bacterium]